jgi:hypothetical protein
LPATSRFANASVIEALIGVNFLINPRDAEKIRRQNYPASLVIESVNGKCRHEIEIPEYWASYCNDNHRNPTSSAR